MVGKRNALAHDKEVGKRIRVRRLQLKMSQQVLGEALGLTFQQIQKYEKGVNRVGAGRLQEIAKALNVSPSFFFDGPRQAGRFDGSHELFDLLDTSQALRLLKAFTQIKDPRIRRSAVELVEGIAARRESSRGRN